MELSKAEKAGGLTLERGEENDEDAADMNILANEAYTAYAKDAAKPHGHYCFAGSHG